jgi:hypothetical protein
MKKSSQESWSPDQDLNQVASKHKTDSAATTLNLIITLLNPVIYTQI